MGSKKYEFVGWIAEWKHCSGWVAVNKHFFTDDDEGSAEDFVRKHQREYGQETRLREVFVEVKP